MRTTITLEDDIAILIERRQVTHKQSLKTVVNEGLRRGLATEPSPGPEASPFVTPSLSLGRPRYSNLDNVAEVLAVAEGDWKP